MASLGNGRIVVFGGCPVAPNCAQSDTWDKSLRDTWTFDSGQWHQQSPADPPNRRSEHVLVHVGAGTARLFGGHGWIDQLSQAGYFNDSWSWFSAAWTPLAGSASPSARWGAAAAWNEARQEVLLFGGRDSGNMDPNDTWRWLPSGEWQRLQAPTTAAGVPAGRFAAALSPYGESYVLFGGRDSWSNSETWTYACDPYDACEWTQSGTSGPSARHGHAMAWDPQRNVVVLFGGAGPPGGGGPDQMSDETWEWDGTWHRVGGLVPPPPRKYHAMVWDETNARMVLFGGISGDYGSAMSDTYVYETVPETPDAGPPQDAGSRPDAGQDAGTPPVADGGTTHPGSDGGTVGPGTPDAGPGPETGYPEDGEGEGREGMESRYACGSTAGAGIPGALLMCVIALLVRRRRAAMLAIGIAFGSASIATAAPAGRPRLAFLGVAASSGIDASIAKGVSEFAQSELASMGAYDVIGLGEVGELLGLEKRKMLLGCEDDASCIAEIGGALGVDRAVTGNLSKVGESLLLNLSLLDVPHARVVGRVGRRVRAGRLDDVLDGLRPSLAELTAADGRTSGTVLLLARGERDLAASGGGAFGVQAGYEKGRFGAAATLLLPVKALRVEARAVPLEAGPVRAVLSAGVTGFLDSLAVRGAAGALARFGSLVVAADFGVERLVVAPKEYAAWAVTLGAGAGAAF